MFTFEQLSQHVTAYREGQLSFDLLEDWYRANSWGAYNRAGDELSDMISAVEAAFSSYELDEINEDQFRQELANAIRPFAPREHAVVVHDVPKYKFAAGAVAVAAALVLAGPVSASVLSSSSHAITVAANPLLDIALVSSSIPSSQVEAEALLS